MEAKSSISYLAHSQAPIRVLLDARKLKGGGIGVYTRNLILGLSARSDIELTVVLNSQDAEQCQLEDWFASVKCIVEDAACYSVDEMFHMPGRIDFSNYDLFHSPHYTLPYRLSIPSVVTVHDIIHLTHPEKFYYPMLAKQLIRSAMRRATRVLTVSHAAKRDLKSICPGAHQHKLRVIHNSISPDFLEQGDHEGLQAKFKISGKYFLAVFSNLKPHKGFCDLLEVFQDLKNSVQAELLNSYKLVLVGEGIENLVENERLLEKTGALKEILVLGKVSQSDLRNLYAGSQALIVPSFSEGFCLPVLEAHAQGKPVITRPVPAIKELLTSQDVVADDFSKEALKNSVLKFIKNNEQCKSLQLKSSLENYNLQQLTDELVKVYRECLPN